MSLDRVNLLTLPNEIIQNSIGSHLSQKDILVTRLVCKHLAMLFGEDNFIWNTKYKPLGLGLPIMSPNKIGKLIPSPLIKTLSLWTYFQKTIENMAQECKNYHSKELRSLCIVATLLPELSPLQSYAIETLKKLHSPEEIIIKEFYLIIAKEDINFAVKERVRILVLKSFLKTEADATIQQIYLSIMRKTMGSNSIELCYLATKGLMPFFSSNSEVSQTMLSTFEYGKAGTVLSVFKEFLTTPVIFDAIVNGFRWGLRGLDQVVGDRLNDPEVVNKLVQKLITTEHLYLIAELAKALIPVADQIPVRDALYQRFSKLKSKYQDGANAELRNAICHTQLTDKTIKKFRKSIPELKYLAKAKKISQLNPYIKKDRRLLLKTLSNKNGNYRAEAANSLAPLVSEDPEILAAFLKLINDKDLGEEAIIAAKTLAPLVSEDPEILAAFLKRIDACILDEAATIIVSGLPKKAYQMDVRTTLIQKGYLNGEISPSFFVINPGLRIATIQALHPFLNEPDVREAVLQSFETEYHQNVFNTLIEMLAPQLDKEDVRTLFLKAAQGKLAQPLPGQIAVVDKLGSIANIPEVQAVLLQLFNKSYPQLKAACIRALCSNKDWRLIDAKKLFISCIDDSKEVSKAARRALKSWTYEAL